MLKKFEVEEYATNLDSAIFNPKKVLDEVLQCEEQKKKAHMYQAKKCTECLFTL
jgi:hypothetical protein